ncbi:CapA family protein [Laceyella putida]|uniref:CapA family protein n=1 Tax=Laceyella putida TaxID=110101 RepID=A0ABW2RKX2_9BACL
MTIFFFCLIVAISFFTFWAPHVQAPSTSPEPSGPEPAPLQPKVVKIAAFGDVMMHLPQVKAGQTAAGGYDFRPFFKEVKPYLSTVDLAIGNLETTLAGKSLPYSGFPRFNAPDEILSALSYAGVDLMSTANNHAIDTGERGVIRTYQQMRKAGIQPVGTAPTAADRKPAWMRKNGVTLAFLAYTESTNGLPVPKEKPYLVNRLNIPQVAKDIAEAKKQGADAVIVSLHFGVEYLRKPNERQTNVAHQILKSGADVILGSHPHVLQHAEKMTVDGKDKLIIYSMGNFISNQQAPYTDEGIIWFFDVEKNPASHFVTLKNIAYLPTFTHSYYGKQSRQYVVLPVTGQTPDPLFPYPGLTKTKWQATWQHTTTLIKGKGDFPVYTK